VVVVGGRDQGARGQNIREEDVRGGRKGPKHAGITELDLQDHQYRDEVGKG
jgi:hypothetical protein